MIREPAIYARQSAIRVDSISVESQIEYCQYELKGEKCRIYIDKGFSGKDTDRPKFLEMMDAVKRGEINRIICYKLDRISRSVIDFVGMMEVLHQYEAEFTSCTEKFDTSTPMGRAMLNICIVFAQLERETIQMRVDDAYKSMSRKGFYMGGRNPYGFKREPYLLNGKNTQRYVQDSSEAHTVLTICKLFQDPSASTGDVIRELDRLGITYPYSQTGRWSSDKIRSIACNPIYVKADMSIYNFFKNNGAIIHNPPEDFNGINGCYLYEEKGKIRKFIRIEGQHLVVAPHEGIVPADIWLSCRIKIKFTGDLQENSIKHWLSKKIKCGKCGYALQSCKNRHTTEPKYVCSRSISPINTCSGIGRIPIKQIESIILNELQRKISQFPTCGKRTEPSSASIALQKQIQEIQTEIDRFMMLLLDANPTTANYINDRIQFLAQKKNELALEIYSVKNEDTRQSSLRVRLSEHMKSWESLTVADKMSIVDAMINSIHVTEDNIQIDWKI